MKHIAFSGILLLAAAGAVSAQQVSDTSYAPPISRPAYEPGKGPRVAIDQAHFNFHTAAGRYEPFANLLRRDGYRVDSLCVPFSADALKGVDVLVIANALNEKNAEDWSLPTPSAFTPDEIAAVRAWVEKGGSLFLIADHMPFAGAATDLARAFGVEYSNGYARPQDHAQGQVGDVFESSTGLRESAVTRGRSGDEKITKVVTFTGSAFRPPKDAKPVLVFGPGALSFEVTKAPGIAPETPTVPIDGWCQGAIMKVGKGRLAVFGEAAMFSAQLGGPNKIPVGMNSPEAPQNHLFLLNVMHWLSRIPGL
jgi:hypothetical protein